MYLQIAACGGNDGIGMLILCGPILIAALFPGVIGWSGNFRDIHLGKRVEDDKPFLLPGGEDPTHVLVTGQTGYGKSRFLNAIARACIDQHEAVVVIEPGDLCDDVIAYYARKVNETGSKDVLKRIHYLRASPRRCFRYDLFSMPKFETFHPE